MTLTAVCGAATEPVDFEDLAARFYRPLYQFAFSLARTDADASDMTQQTFYLWATKGHQLNNTNKVETWLFTTLYREFLQTRRRQTRFPHLELDQAAAQLPWVLPLATSPLDAAQVLATLARVNEIYQVPVALFYVQGYHHWEIAKILGIPVGTVKSRLARGLKQLQQMLSHDIRVDKPAKRPTPQRKKAQH